MTTPTLQELDAAQTRLANAQSARLEWDLARDKRQLLTVVECFSLLKQLRDVALEKVSWQERSMLEKHMSDALELFGETIKRIQEDAGR